MNKNNKLKSNKTVKPNDAKNTSSMERKSQHAMAKHYLSKKKSFFAFESGKDIINILLTVTIAFVSTYLYLPWHGIISTFPFAIIGAFACTFIKMHPALKLCIFFACPFSVSALMNESVPYAFAFGVSCVAFYVLMLGAKTCFQRKNVKYRIISMCLIVLALSLHVFENSTPWSVYKNKSAFEKYIIETYGDEPLYASDIRFDFFDRTYKTMLVPEDNKAISLKAAMKDEKIVLDEYIEYSEKYNMIIGAGKITESIRKLYPTLNFKVESNQIKGYPFANKPSVISNVDYSKYMDFSIYFESYNDVKKFSALAESCYRALLKTNFNCRTLTFYGGIGTRYIVKISVPFNSTLSNLENFVTPCDDELFTYSALDILEIKQ